MEAGLRDTWCFSPFSGYWDRSDGEEAGVTDVNGERLTIEGCIGSMSRILIERFYPSGSSSLALERGNAEWDSDIDLLVIMPHEVVAGTCGRDAPGCKEHSNGQGYHRDHQRGVRAAQPRCWHRIASRCT